MGETRDSSGRFILGFKHSEETKEKIRRFNSQREKKRVTIVCRSCKTPFQCYPYRALSAMYCSHKCRSRSVGKDISLGKLKHVPILTTQGYWKIYYPSHHRAVQKYAKMADLVYERYYRPLNDNEVVHHKDGCKTNDHPDNLEAMDKIEHDKMHAKLRYDSGDVHRSPNGHFAR